MWTGLVFAGGSSRRMGRDKAMIELGGLTLLERAVGTVRSAGGDPIVVGRPRPAAEAAFARQIDDQPAGGPPPGPLQALRCGLAASSSAGAAVALACDLPLLPSAFLRFLIEAVAGWDAVVPRVGGTYQVLAAAYGPGCLPAVEAALAEGERAVHRFLGAVRVLVVEDDRLAPFGGDEIFLNVNTPADLERARKLLLGSGS